MNLLTKIVVIVAVVYVLIVVVFESLLGYYQPQAPGTLVITTTDADGDTHDRVLSELESGGEVYVAVNHWPRAWYRRVLVHPEVDVTRDGEMQRYSPCGRRRGKGGRGQDNPAPFVFRRLSDSRPGTVSG